MRFDITSIQPSRIAAVLIYVALVIQTIALCTPNWLAGDGRAPQIRFERLGLFEACFVNFQDHHLLYDRVWNGCRWLLDEDFYYLRDFLFPPFFVAVQFLYIGGFLMISLACFAVVAIQLCFIIDREVLAFRLLSLVSFLGAVFCTTAVVIFGIMGDDLYWMPDPDFNYLSWSFALAAVGAVIDWMAAILFYAQSRIVHRQEMKEYTQEYQMQQRTSAKSRFR